MTLVVSDEFGTAKPDGSEVIVIVAWPETPVVIGRVTELFPGANATVAGTEATVGVLLLTGTCSVVVPASTSVVPKRGGFPVPSSQVTKSPTVLIVPFANPVADDGAISIVDGAS